jgi:hypothetical protein
LANTGQTVLNQTISYSNNKPIAIWHNLREASATGILFSPGNGILERFKTGLLLTARFSDPGNMNWKKD